MSLEERRIESVFQPPLAVDASAAGRRRRAFAAGATAAVLVATAAVPLFS